MWNCINSWRKERSDRNKSLSLTSERKKMLSMSNRFYQHSFIHSHINIHSVDIQAISIVTLQVHSYSEVLPTQHKYRVGVSRQSATGNCQRRTCPRSLRGSHSGIRTHDPSDESTNEPQRPTIYKHTCAWMCVDARVCLLFLTIHSAIYVTIHYLIYIHFESNHNHRLLLIIDNEED